MLQMGLRGQLPGLHAAKGFIQQHYNCKKMLKVILPECIHSMLFHACTCASPLCWGGTNIKCCACVCLSVRPSVCCENRPQSAAQTRELSHENQLQSVSSSRENQPQSVSHSREKQAQPRKQPQPVPCFKNWRQIDTHTQTCAHAHRHTGLSFYM